jgi:dolichol-phosphate mannosyltransferase
LSDSWIWAPRTEESLFNYDIHGIVTIASDGRLPELQRFKVEGPISDPDVRVRIGKLEERGVAAQELDENHTRMHYVEKFGNLGFGARFDLGERVDITATPVLRHSPHVLYTNIVEPVLRWTFVERGYALVHAACVAFGDDALLVTAKTDTGKTTTVLRTLDTTPCAFVSDDLTLVRADGHVLAYPKPLTISAHTVGAIKAPMLRRHERVFLPLQSRLHSRSGRRAGLAIARSRLPAATMNALVQAMIPPPKYDVARLVSGVRLTETARLTGLVLMERDGDGRLPVTHFEALEQLMRNCDDAYTFPPYPAIEGFLHSRDGADLRAVERAIVGSALENVPATLLRSSTREWSTQIPLVAAENAAVYAHRPRSGAVPQASAHWKVSPTRAPE